MTESMYYVLLALRRPILGGRILEEIASVSVGRVRMGPGTLYTLLVQLLKKNWIVVLTDADQRKCYAITEQGCEALNRELALLSAMARDGAAAAEVRA